MSESSRVKQAVLWFLCMMSLTVLTAGAIITWVGAASKDIVVYMMGGGLISVSLAACIVFWWPNRYR